MLHVIVYGTETICNQGHLTWVTLLWYLTFSLPILFCEGFLEELSNFLANIEREKENDVKHNISMLFLQFTQVLMSLIVVMIWLRGENEMYL